MWPNKITVLKFVQGFAFGGTGRLVLDLAPGLDPSRFKVHMRCLKCTGPFVGEIRARGVPLAEYKINSLHNHTTLREQLWLATYIRRN